MDTRRMFLRHVAQTSSSPIAIHVQKAKGSRIRDMDGREYIDLIAGISVCNIGHRHPSVLRAMRKQMDEYLHVLVYGEMIETPQVEYAALLAEHLPPTLNSVYFTNSGAEAVEGAMKLAKRATGRTEIIAFNQSYHGSTQGALSIIGDEYWRNAYRPLLPGITHAEYNSSEAIDLIGENTACVIMETVQAERGVYPPSPDWIQALRKKCNSMGTLLILDEIQTGFGRCGSLWAFEQYGIVPDILLLGKALGGGLPLGAFIAEKQLMRNLTVDPVLGHITTFGGHPLSCAAGLAAFTVLIKKDMPSRVAKKEALFRSLLNHPGIRAVRSSGLLIALELENATQVQQVVSFSLANGVLTDWFLFAPQCLRIAPPLNISTADITQACEVILNALDSLNPAAS
ncbi:MAG TPA: aminotransferase class III-fold pyridoxal phosphate-dependent enzyme [Flavitalea sp.]|nr:aminotransferase class III-fold pyridoxal phosphate-dependent enzyme [Flavitalea sp.]